jgi:hypothetical protein
MLPLSSFLDRINIIRKDDYTPSDQVGFQINLLGCKPVTLFLPQDILRCRVMTNSIQRIDFEVKDGRANVKFRYPPYSTIIVYAIKLLF